ncbi:MAG: NifB/NifX family molybdenum-iron cluster-binding protein [Oligoflexia bacterium]|nr:NifB/NifX family molybdenum-iron cluster-binding protein [Oligoflexia bacterium]
MKIAIPTASGVLCNHFGHCEIFTIFEVDEKNKTILTKEEITPPPHEPGKLPPWLASHGVNVILTGGMGKRALDLFDEKGIKVIVGVSADKPEELVEKYMKKALVGGQNVCDH